MPRRRTVNMSSSPSRSDPAASGWVLSSSAPEPAGLAKSRVGVGVGERSTQAGVDVVSGFGREVAFDVAALVDLAALNEGEVSEHCSHAGGERFGAVDDDEQASAVVEASGHDVGQQGSDDGLVLGVAEP